MVTKQHEHQVEGVKTSLRSPAIELLSLQPYLSPQFKVTVATKNRGEQNAQLMVDSSWPEVGKMERLVGLQRHLLVKRIRLRGA